MKLIALLLLAFMVVVVTVDAHDDKRMLQTGRQEGNAPARPAPALDDKKAEEEKKAQEEKRARGEKRAQEEKKAQEERKAQEEKRAQEEKKAEEEKKAREKRLRPQVHSSQANRDPFASSRFETSRPSPDMLRYLRAKRR